MPAFPPELPQYKCHKTVRAARITALRQNGTSDMPDLVLGDIGGIVTLLPDWHAKHKPQVGGYYVVYDDGYASFSPANAFEEGYALLTSIPAPPSDLRGALQRAINCHSAENGSNTPDFVLAGYLIDAIAAFDRATKGRDEYYCRTPTPVEAPSSPASSLL